MTWKTLTQELKDLEHSDPEVGAAARSYDATVDRILHPEDYVMPANLEVE